MEPGQQDLDRSHSELVSLEQSLLASFRTAARSVTQLYKDAQRTQRFTYRQGYEQCLQDLLDFLASHPHVQQREAGLGAASIPADDLVNYAQAKHAELMVETEKSPPPSLSATDIASSVSGAHSTGSVQANPATANSTNNHTTLSSMIFNGADTVAQPFQFVPPSMLPLATNNNTSTNISSGHAALPANSNNGTPTTSVPFKRRHPPNEMSFLGRDVDMSDFESHGASLPNMPLSSMSSNLYGSNGSPVTSSNGNIFGHHGGYHNNNTNGTQVFSSQQTNLHANHSHHNAQHANQQGLQNTPHSYQQHHQHQHQRELQEQQQEQQTQTQRHHGTMLHHNRPPATKKVRFRQDNSPS
ncbi:hypothetical protein BDF22DRAFT_652345 [Syncephalis plumigaleata]|nr:hypothetical protein BDF22DRAFT_652345 [Syncephalis plumigaleata]